MSAKTKEVAEVEILTPEQIEAFPKAVKENIQFLSTEMNPRDLAVFNPLVSELLKIREQGAKLKLRNPDAEGNFNKENVQQFVDLKKDIRTYRAEVGRSAKKLKEPYLKIQKGIIVVEKTFVDEATTVYDQAEVEFAPYIKAEEEKAAAKEAEKNKELLEATKRAEEEAAAEKAKSAKSEIYNYIKYEQIAERITSKTSTAIVESNERSLQEIFNELSAKTFEGITASSDTSILDPEILTELEMSFNASKKNSLALITDKLEAYKLTRENEALQAKQSMINNPVQNIEAAAETIDANIPPAVPPVPGSRPLVEPYNYHYPGEDLSDEEFLLNIKERLNVIERLVADRISKQVCSPTIHRTLTLVKSLKDSM